MNYILHDTIVKVEERSRVVRTKKGPGDTILDESENLGWWLVLGCGISIQVGDEKPSFEPGDTIRITIEPQERP